MTASSAAAVTLRARTAADVEVLYRMASDLDTWEQRTPSPPRPVTRESFERRLAEPPADDDGVEFVIDADGAPVGRCTLFGFDPLAHHAECGITLLPEARGQGIGTRALAELVEFGFVRRHLHRVHLIVLASNAAALRSYAKVGFVEEGRRREHAWARGEWVDEVVMGLLHAEWSRAGG